ncbi:hypothetical protein [Geodermatophilus nigrescens]|uniref:Uncharacterized protein n=1 Tax=Geodermatophilus nigrescens TaxID=1070870 RepID=A0A1M5PXB6_9ACTN|nr:hypothetical protein [Geodermatophilus nigrescens]SHH06310.1 hypothetical protein SAMN05444351_3896 [Geodermatophilus nigrescens]
MAAVLLSVHVVVAVVFVGAVTIAVSLFPRYAREALADGTGSGSSSGSISGSGSGSGAGVPALRLLHRVTRVYAVLSLAVPVFGVATASALGVLGNAWVLASMALTLLAAGLLAGVVLPGQQELLAAATRTLPAGGTLVAARARVARLAAASGAFNLVWVAVVVLMVVRPGSTTGV